MVRFSSTVSTSEANRPDQQRGEEGNAQRAAGGENGADGQCDEPRRLRTKREQPSADRMDSAVLCAVSMGLVPAALTKVPAP